MTLRVGSLFSGIGGFELGLERAGMRTVFQVEIEPYARAVLEKHWPGVHRHDDVRTARGAALPDCDLLAFGFPCQNISAANTGGTRTGLAGEKSALWLEGLRLARECRPAWVLVENAGREWRDWVPVVRRDFWAAGYASMPIRVRAERIGAPHRRDRGFVVAHADRNSQSVLSVHEEVARVQEAPGLVRHWRTPPPGGFRLAHGVSTGLVGHQLAGYGNAVMPQMAELLGRAVVTVHSRREAA